MSGPLHFNVEVNIEESPESSPPGPPSPATAPPAPIPVDNLAFVWEQPNNGTNFMTFYTRADVLELKDWARVTRKKRNEEGYMVEQPLIPENFRAFLVEYHGTQWEIKVLGAAAEPLFAQLMAYVADFTRLTSHNKRIFRQPFEAWSITVKGEQLRLLAESGGFLEIESAGRFCRSSGALQSSAAFYMFCTVVFSTAFFWNCITSGYIFGFLNCFCKRM